MRRKEKEKMSTQLKIKAPKSPLTRMRGKERGMKATSAKVIRTNWHHLPPESGKPPVKEGMTTRQAIEAIRAWGRWRFGNMGGMLAEMDDGTRIEVECWYGKQGTGLMSSQEIKRTAHEDGREVVIRKYKW